MSQSLYVITEIFRNASDFDPVLTGIVYLCIIFLGTNEQQDKIISGNECIL